MSVAADVVVVLVTVPDATVADRVARTLVDEQLVACCNVLPGVTSIYRWHGKTETASEQLIVAKTALSRVDDVVTRVRALHPYDLPEVIALPVAAGLPAYLRWVLDETAPRR